MASVNRNEATPTPSGTDSETEVETESSSTVSSSNDNAIDSDASGATPNFDNSLTTDNTAVANSSDSTETELTDPPITTEQNAAEEISPEQVTVSITDGLPAPDVAVNIVSPFEVISAEIQTLTSAAERYKQDLADDNGNVGAQTAIDRIGTKLTMLASTNIVKSNGALGKATAEGLVKSVGVTAENQEILAELVRSNSAITEEYIKSMLSTPSLNNQQRESLVFGIAASPATMRKSLQSNPEYNKLTNRFKEAIVAKIKQRNFQTAAGMTSVALLLEPDDESLQLLSNHLLQSE